jgi:chromosome segregation ATPase
MSDEPNTAIIAALSRLEAGQAALQQAVAALATRAELAQVRAELTQVRLDLMGRMDRLEAGQERLETSQTSLRADTMERMDRLQDSLTDIRNDIGVNFGASDAVKRANDNTREEVRALSEMMSALVRKVRALETRVREITGDP